MTGSNGDEAAFVWHAFDYANKAKTAPEHNDLVWINEEFYEGVTFGFFDGRTFRTWTGSDDCSVSHWAEIEYPDAPEGVLADNGGDDD